jgi:hypothetical protein
MLLEIAKVLQGMVVRWRPRVVLEVAQLLLIRLIFVKLISVSSVTLTV